MLSSLGSSQVRVTESWVTVADRPVGLSGTGAAGMSMWNQREPRIRYVSNRSGRIFRPAIDEAASIVRVNSVCHWNFCARLSRAHAFRATSLPK